MNIALVLVGLCAAFLVLSVAQMLLLTFWVRREVGLGRILFFGLLALKSWCAIVLIISLLATGNPGYLPEQAKAIQRVILATSLLVETVVTNVALVRWRFPTFRPLHPRLWRAR